MSTTKPAKLKVEHLNFLDKLRDSGATNMFGAGEWLQKAFKGLNRQEATAILAYWMQTFTVDRQHAKTLRDSIESPAKGQ